MVAASKVQPLAVSPRDARTMLGCCHQKIYQLIGSGELKSFKIGRARKITVESIKAYIERRLRNDARGKRSRRAT
jgi:excisionase family DNA binding protein